MSHHQQIIKCVVYFLCLNLCGGALKEDPNDNGISPASSNPEAEEDFNSVNWYGLEEHKSSRISLQMCNRYYSELFRPDLFPLLGGVGGGNALAKKYKHMALIGYGTGEDDITWACGGSLISDKYILTAAHCIENIRGPPTWVRLGELDTATNRDDADPQDFRITRAIIHPEYNTFSYYHDIGLLELDRPVNFTRYIFPACLHQSDDIVHQFATATGWGALKFLGMNNNHLKEVNLVIVNHTRCSQFFQTSPTKFPKGIIADMQICAGGNDGSDTCQGDSGGPLQVKRPESYFGLPDIYDIVGITSFGRACGIIDTPAVYIKVYFYLDWIENVVWS